jgi:hypothetical protein
MARNFRRVASRNDRQLLFSKIRIRAKLPTLESYTLLSARRRPDEEGGRSDEKKFGEVEKNLVGP